MVDGGLGNEVNDLHLILARLKAHAYLTHGELSVNGLRLGYTREPAGWRKIHMDPLGIIPPGLYRVVVSFSETYQRHVPEIVGVPGFADVRIHGCEMLEPQTGHILLGKDLTPDGVRDTDTVNKVLISMLGETINTRHKCWINVR